MLPLEITHYPFSLCFPCSLAPASLCSVSSHNWGPSIVLLTFCVLFISTKSSIKLDRLTVTSVSELETDWRLILCCLFWLCFVALTSSNQQPLQTSNSNPPYQHKPKRKHPHHLSNQTAVLSFPCMQKQKQDPTQCTEASDSTTLHNWTFYPHIASRAYN